MVLRTQIGFPTASHRVYEIANGGVGPGLHGLYPISDAAESLVTVYRSFVDSTYAAAEDQANDRAHRIGQDKPVTVVRLVVKGTIEEAVLSLHAEKRELAASLLDGADVAGKLSAQQLSALVRAGEGALGEVVDVEPVGSDRPPAGPRALFEAAPLPRKRGRPPRT